MESPYNIITFKNGEQVKSEDPIRFDIHGNIIITPIGKYTTMVKDIQEVKSIMPQGPITE